MSAWWAEFFWSRTDKTGAAFRRGCAIGSLTTLVAVAMLTKALA